MHSPRVRRFLTPLLALTVALPAIAQTANPAPAPSPTEEKKDVLQLSPFTVTTTKDQGYFAENTLAGSRLRMNISDLGSSITVVTKQQMEDTGSLDINDVFRYEANTEGSSTYTPSVQSLRNDGVVDVNAGYTHGGDGQPQTNASANRVRGLGVPSSSSNYYPSISQVPFDAYNIQSIEISRGPNSMIFGMGSPAGIVNSSTAQAVIGRDAASVSLRTDDQGSQRASFNFNKSLIDDRLAIYGAFLVDNREFARKPSYDDTRRMYGTFTSRPFQKTTFRGSIEKYENDNNRPNTLTPRDGVTQWRAGGSPTYDPSTGRITRNGQYAGTLALRAGSPRIAETRAYIESRPGYNPALWNTARTAYNGINIFGGGALTTVGSALFTPGLGLGTTSRPIQQIADGEVVNWFSAEAPQYRQVFGTTANPAANAALFPAEAAIFANPLNAAAYDTSYSNSAFFTAVGNGVGSYRYPGVTDRSIYDWENINILSMNFGHDENTTMNLELEQELLPNLNFSAGWFRQDFKSTTNYTVSQLNVATLFVDTNVKLPDGRANPYFGLPFVEDFDPDRFINNEVNDSRRAMLAWTPDFTNNDGWTKWLGRHQFLGLVSRNESTRSFIRQRWFITASDEGADGTIFWSANPNNNTDGSPTGWNRQGRSGRRLYYLSTPGSPTDGSVTRGSGMNSAANRQSGEVQIWNHGTSSWSNMGLTQEFIDMDASTGRTYRQVDSNSLGVTSTLWNDRLVATLGMRTDDYKARATTNGVVLAQDGTTIAAAMTNPQKWINGVYQTDVVLNRWNRWDLLKGDTKTMGGVLKPFKNWGGIDRRANDGSAWWDFVRSVGFSYNKSDNFNPPTAAQVDGFGTPLPKPTGEGTDYGVQFSLFDNKLFARINWFESSNQNERTNPGTSISRLTGNVDTTLFRNWARTIALINSGEDPRLIGFGEGLTPAEEQSIQDAAAVIWKLPYNYYNDIGTIFATRSAVAEGKEFQLTYNPSTNWTMKFTAGEQVTKYSNVMREFYAWYDERSPVWIAARASDYLLPQYQSLATYSTSGGRAVNLTTFLNSYGYDSAVRLDEPNGNFNVQRYYDNVVTPQVAIATDLEGQAAPGQRKYRWSYLTNYTFNEGRFKGFSVGGSVRWEDKAIIGYYGRANTAAGTTDLTLSDTTRPIYDDANTYTDLWMSYTRKVFSDKVRMKVQLNIVNAFESGGLQVVGVNYDGSPNAYRIIDPRQFILQTTFDF
ncbi:TonB-dependent receptor plug domain-containing protein [Lacunisphaera limnophila]|nr:TonB-dependent receptor plug domain-containing protein [Lacunisphaera limnophila]